MIEQISDYKYDEAAVAVEEGRSFAAKYKLPVSFSRKFDELAEAIKECKELHLLKVCAGRIKLDPEEDESFQQLDPTVDDLRAAFSTLLSEATSCIPSEQKSFEAFRLNLLSLLSLLG